MKQTHIVLEEFKDLRLDVFLTNALPEVPSRTFIKKMIDGGQVTVNGKVVKANYKVESRDKIIADVNAETFAPQDIKAEKMDLDVFYEDEDIVVINKPEGLTVHPASGSHGGTLVNGLVYRYEALSDVNGEVRPGIVHRLDRDTSGLIVIAKTNMAHARLGRQFEKHTIMKRYVARVQGNVQFDQGVIDQPLKRHVKYHDQRQIAKEGEGKEAVTVYEVLKRFGKSTLVALFPQTGRTHQLRVHMKHLGHVILGDEKYGRQTSFPRLALHAQGIGFIHPTTRRYIEFSSPVPAVFTRDDL